MNFDDMKAAVDQAKSTLSPADSFDGRMAAMLVGRLRTASVMPWVLTALKRELAGWDMHRKQWKEPK